MNPLFDNLYQNIRNILLDSRKRTSQAINFALVETYWHIGKMIVEEEQNGKARADYGKQILAFLSEKLTTEFGQGFDQSNLRHMRLFYNAFPIRDALRHELTWTHYRLLAKVENENARLFYRDEAIAAQWSTRQTERQIHSFYYERILSSQDRKQMLTETNDEAEKLQVRDIIKDPYVLDFLDIQVLPKLTEKDLETALINQLQAFLLELGKGFAFVARQKRIPTDNKNFYIDLVFYNILLKCYVLIDLKIGELSHNDIGQMDMYTRYFEDKIRGEDDNPTIGIILCSEKDEAVVKYSVLSESQQLFASKYMLYLPTEEELAQELKREIANFRIEKGLLNTEND
jgi:predicted nuclease of restriction endonuclease-like (RecB) superfamily